MIDAHKQRQAMMLQQQGTSGPTPEDSVDDGVDDSIRYDDDDGSSGGSGGGYDRREAVMRASLVRCASNLIEKGPHRRATVEVSDPATQKAARDAVLQNVVLPPGPSASGPDPMAAVLQARRASDGAAGSAGATQKVVDEWVSIPPHIEEEPLPWGHGEQRVTAATSVQKLLQ